MNPVLPKVIGRRRLLAAAGTLFLAGFPPARRRTLAASAVTLLSAPIELGGDWGQSLPSSALAVIARTREVSLAGVRLLSDQQPDRLRVDDHATGPPFVWLHSDPPREAWIIVDIGTRDWSKLAYQFGHELGHVLCNSWQLQAKPRLPCQWLEESMVEAFSIRGLGLLAKSWELDPPFPGTGAFGKAIQDYRGKMIEIYQRAGGPVPGADIAAWFSENRGALAKSALDPIDGPAILAIVQMIEQDKGCVEDMGAVNRWPESALPLEAYLVAWTASCAEIGSPGRLPVQIRSRLGLS
jgi:hypothetical protein